MAAEKFTPTDSELAILNVLWKHGPSTVHEVRDALGQEQGYTTVLKLMQIMHDKQLVSREKEGRAHRYEAAIEKENVQQNLLDRLMDTAFDGSMSQLLQQAISSKELDKSDWEELNQLMDKLKDQSKDT